MGKKLLSFILALALLFSLTAAFAEEEREFVVGNTTQMKGDFLGELFGNNTADIDVRALIHGYDLVHWDEEQGVYRFDPSVIAELNVDLDAEGNKVFTFTLCDDLYWSDGTAITAWDYAFSILLTISPEVATIGGRTYSMPQLLGSAEYLGGALPYLPGVGVTDERTLVITVDRNYLPFFYEVGLLSCVPYPIGAIAPGCLVYSDGEDRNWNAPAKNDENKTRYGMGIYIGNEDLSVETPAFTAELLADTILDPATGYNSHPSVVSGPYTLEAFDGVTAHFKLNPYYKGALSAEFYRKYSASGDAAFGKLTEADLVKPTIPAIAYTRAYNDTVIQDLLDGKLDLANKVMYAEAVSDGAEAVKAGNDAGRKLNMARYNREGLSFVNFSYEMPEVADMRVRQAIAWCMDRDAIIKEYCGENGFRMDGFFGIEMWEYLMATNKLVKAYNFASDPKYSGVTRHVMAEDERWDKLSLDGLTAYTVNTRLANGLLDEAGWTLDADGNAYEAGEGSVRHKLVDGELVSLNLTLAVPQGNRIADLLPDYFAGNLAECGIALNVVEMPMSDLLDEYYRTTERSAQIYYLATNFNVMYDPSLTYLTDVYTDRTRWNDVYTDDEQLYALAVDMRSTDPDEVYEYVQKWISFQERYNEVLPSLPVYSNVYFDFYTAELTNYNITAHVTWTQAILSATWNAE